MKYFLAASVLVSACLSVQAQEKMKPEDTEVWTPVPKTVTVEGENHVPSDAVVLFDGSSLDAWVSSNDKKAAPWTVEDGIFTVKPGSGGIETKQQFEDYQLHIEWRSPLVIKGEGQGRGNSGVFMQGIYEVQVLDTYNNKTYVNGQAASIYKQHIPLVSAVKKPGEWHSYDIIWTAPRFNADGSVKSKARITVLHNGILVQNNVEIEGTTEYIGLPKYKAHGPGPIALQDHGNPVSYRNVWIRPL